MGSTGSNVKWLRRVVAVVVLAAVGTAVWYALGRGKAVAVGKPSSSSEAASGRAGVFVEVVAPRKGGIDRICLQPGSVEPFEAADLYVKVSGFLTEQNVDIGYPVHVGDVLARISVPEYVTQVKQDSADVVRAVARVDQMNAGIATAEADLGAADAAIGLAQAEMKSKTSYRGYREKQRDRIKELVARSAIDAKLLDEHEDQYQAAVSAELASTAVINAAKLKAAAGRARVEQAKADRRYAEAEVATTRARLEKSQVLLDYTIIRSPYNGVVTKRNFHPGDFIRSADASGDRVPLLAVERTDVMRVVVQVPERDVPLVDCGDPAVVEFDALPGEVFKTRGAVKVEVSRLAASEDPSFRMMRTEVHLKNTNGKLRRGMFGRVAITLQAGAPNSLRIPSAALVGKADGGKASVRVVRDDKAYLVPVVYGADNGSDVEVLSGLTTADRVIVRAASALNDGTVVVVDEGKASKVGR